MSDASIIAFAVLFGLVVVAVVVLAFVEPDRERYPDGLWPPREER